MMHSMGSFLLLFVTLVLVAAPQHAAAIDVCSVFSPGACNPLRVPTGVALKYCTRLGVKYPCGLEFKFEERSLCSGSARAGLERLLSLCSCGAAIESRIGTWPKVFEQSTTQAADPITGLTSPVLAELSNNVACMINAGLHVKDIDRDEKLAELKGAPAPSVAGRTDWTLTSFELRLADYADFASRVAICTAALLSNIPIGHRRLLEAPLGLDNATSNASALLALASISPSVNESSAGVANPADIIPAGGETPTPLKAPSMLSAIVDKPPSGNRRFVRPHKLRAGLADAVAAPPAGGTVGPALLEIPLACQSMVDWAAIKVDYTVNKLVPIAIEHIKPVADLLAVLIDIADQARPAAMQLVDSNAWQAYINACTGAFNTAVSNGLCNNVCGSVLGPVWNTMLSANTDVQQLAPLVAGIAPLIEPLGYYLDAVRESVCEASRVLTDTEFRKVSLYQYLGYAAMYKRLPAYPRELSDAVVAVTRAQDSVGWLEEVGEDVSERATELANITKKKKKKKKNAPGGA